MIDSLSGPVWVRLLYRHIFLCPLCPLPRDHAPIVALSPVNPRPPISLRMAPPYGGVEVPTSRMIIHPTYVQCLYMTMWQRAAGQGCAGNALYNEMRER